MKLHFHHRRAYGLTLPELLVVIAVLLVLAMMLLPIIAASHKHSGAISCIINLKQINLSQRIGEGDVRKNYVVANWRNFKTPGDWFQSLSNAWGTPKILICPAALDHPIAATNFQNDFNASHVSYFANLDASEKYPQMILSGDDNLAINSVPMKSGFDEISANAVVSWIPGRHGFINNVGFADGSVSELSNNGLQQALALGTNGVPSGPLNTRLAIP